MSYDQTTADLLRENAALRAEVAQLRAERARAEPVAMVLPHGATVRLDWASVSAAHNTPPGTALYATPPAPAQPEAER